MSSIPERDWKKFRAMKAELLNVACERILKNVATVLEGKGDKNHEAYLKLWNILKKADDNIATMFDDLKRSNAVYKLAAWKRNGLVADEELAQFSGETQETIRILNRE